MSSSSQESQRTRRSWHQTKACILCQGTKKRCVYDKPGPCEACQKHGIDCKFVPDMRTAEARQLRISGSSLDASGSTLPGPASQREEALPELAALSGTAMLAMLAIVTIRLRAFHHHRRDRVELMHPSDDDQTFDENIMGTLNDLMAALICVIPQHPLQATEEGPIPDATNDTMLMDE